MRDARVGKPNAAVATAAPSEQRLSFLQQAAGRAPTDFKVWRAYVLELRLAGQKVKAKKAAQTAKVSAAQRRDLKEIASGHRAPVDDIVAMINAGTAQKAWETGAARLRHFAKDPRLLNVMGVAALGSDDTTKAESVFRQALALAPNDQAVRANLGYALLRQHRALEVVDLLKSAANQRDASLDIRANLAIALWTVGKFTQADTLTESLMKEAPNDPEVVGIRAKTLISQNNESQALSLLDTFVQSGGAGLEDIKATALRAANGLAVAVAYLDELEQLPPQTNLRVTTLLAEWGEIERATKRARDMAQSDPSDFNPVRLIGLLSKWQPDDPLIETVRKNAQNQSMTPLKRGTFGLVHAKALRDLGDHTAAMDALDTANATLRSLITYDVAQDEEMMRDIAACWTTDAIKNASTDMDTPKPIFIVGLPRSGSTLLETVLSCHPDVESLGESPVAFTTAFKARANSKPDAIKAIATSLGPTLTPSAQKAVVTDKLLANFLNVGVLAAAFPGARFIGMRRDYRATCFSIYGADLNASAHPYAMNLEELGRYAVACETLMTHWANVLGTRFIQADYEALVTNPNDAIFELLKNVSLTPNEACFHPENSERSINTMSVEQARKPISKKAVAKWQLSEEQLGPLINILDRNGLI